MTCRVAIIANSFSATFVFRKSLLEYLKSSGILGPVISSCNDISNVNQDGLNAKLVFFDCEKFGSLFRSFLGICRLLRESNVGVIHGFTHIGNLIAWLSSLVNRSGLVLTVTGMGRVFSCRSFYCRVFQFFILAFYWIAKFKASAVIVQNRDDLLLFSQLLGKASKTKLFLTNGSGIDVSHFHGVRPYHFCKNFPGTIVIGFFSRALPEKGVDDFYKLADACSSMASLKFVHVGHPGVGMYSAENIIATASQMNVEFKDFVVDIRPYLLAVDIVVIPSIYREGLSRLLIEAMLAGKVVIARTTTGVRDHIKTGNNGILYDSDLKCALETALGQDSNWLRKKARLYAEQNFDVRIVNSVYIKAYRLAKASN